MRWRAARSCSRRRLARPISRTGSSRPISGRAPRHLWMGPRSARGDGVADADRIGHVAEILDALAGAAHANRAVTQQPPHERLDDIDRLDLVHVHLDRIAPQEATLVDDAMVGDRELGDPADEPGVQESERRHYEASPATIWPSSRAFSVSSLLE